MPSPLFQQKNWKASRIGLGLAALGRPGYINLGHAKDLQQDYKVANMEARTHEVLDEAWKLGIRYFDAAQSYGKAEEFLSSWLAKQAATPAQLAVGSKWGYTYTADWKVVAEKHEVKEHSIQVLNKQWPESWERLHPYLQLYQIHSATFESGVLANKEVLNRLSEIKQEGTWIGLSLSGPAQAAVLEKALEVEIDKVPLFNAVQASWNILERSAEEMLIAAHNEGLKIIIKEALANGRLTLRNQEEAFQAKLSKAQGDAKRLNGSLDAWALAAVLARPWVDIVLSGAATVEHIQSNMRAEVIIWDGQAEKVIEDFVEEAEEYWQKRKALEWN